MRSIRFRGALLAMVLAAAAGPWTLRLLGQNDDELVVKQRSARSGRPTFATARGAGVLLPGAAAEPAAERALRFVDGYGATFGASRRDLRVTRAGAPDELGIEHVRFQQLYNGIPVAGSEFLVHLRADRVVAANGDLLEVFPASVTPAFPADSAARTVRAMFEKSSPARAAGIALSQPRLEVFNRGLFESRRTDSNLAWFIEARGDGVREFIWIDAQTNELLLNFSALSRARSRAIHTAAGTSTLPGTLVRSEGQGPTGDPDQDNAYIYAGSFYDYFSSTFGRDSFDNAGGVLRVTTEYKRPAFEGEVGPQPCDDIFWNGSQVVACDGYGMADDILAHEFSHGVITWEPDLFSYGQSGAIAEALADIFGETIDQQNATGNDAAGVKWQIGEDLTGGPIRHMMTPLTFGDPGKMSDPMWCDLVNDNGGVHHNSGIPNHAYALMVDGGTYNGYTVSGIGLAKAARIQYRAMTAYLTVNSTFADYFSAVAQACGDLVGTSGITPADCTQATNAMQAVELGAEWGCGVAAPEPALCPAGGTPSYLFQDGFEGTLAAWTTAGSVGPGTWNILTSFPGDGSASAHGTDVDAISDHRLAMNASVALPAGARMAFDHFYEFEIDALGEVPSNPIPGGGGFFNFDGGVLEYSTNGGASWQDAGALIDGGVAYGGTIDDREGDFGNPLLGRQAFVGYQPGFRRTRLNLSSLSGQSVRFRFRIGTDNSIPDRGWFLDSVGIYTCSVAGGAPTISAGPQSATLPVGGNVVLSVTASGSGLTYQWLKSGIAIQGATTSSLSLTNVQDTDAGSYSVLVSNASGTATSNAGLITVIAPGGWGGQSSQNDDAHPISFTVAGSAQTLTQITAEGAFNSCTQTMATAIAAPIVGNQFSVDTGATTCGLRIRAQGQFDSAKSATGTLIMNLDNSGESCAITCNGHYVATFTATAGAPTITVQPRDRTTPSGSSVQFSVGASGTPSPTYQWQISTNGGANWTNLANGGFYSGVTTATLSLTGVNGTLNSARYRAIATNAVGAATSDGAILTVSGTEMVQNGSFSSGTTNWLLFATPDMTYMSWVVEAGVFKYYRNPPPPGTSNQAVIFQNTGIPLGKGAALSAGFDLGNSSSVRKRVSVLMIDSDFSDITVCTFWLPASAPMRRYQMKTHTTKAWTNASIYFYAASAGSNGGHYMLDNVSMQQDPTGSPLRTDCVDPLAPEPPGGADSASLLGNGDFSAGMTSWGTFGQIQFQVSQGVFEFVRPAGTPSGVVLQGSGDATTANEILTVRFDLGNSSALRKRVTVLVHDLDFSDLTACTFWLNPGQALSTYTIRAYSTEAWSNATVSFYPATVGTQPWLRLDNVSMQRTPSAVIAGTECVEPAALLISARGTTGFSTPLLSPASASSSFLSASLLALQDDAVGDGSVGDWVRSALRAFRPAFRPALPVGRRR